MQATAADETSNRAADTTRQDNPPASTQGHVLPQPTAFQLRLLELADRSAPDLQYRRENPWTEVTSQKFRRRQRHAPKRSRHVHFETPRYLKEHPSTCPRNPPIRNRYTATPHQEQNLRQHPDRRRQQQERTIDPNRRPNMVRGNDWARTTPTHGQRPKPTRATQFQRDRPRITDHPSSAPHLNSRPQQSFTMDPPRYTTYARAVGNAHQTSHFSRQWALHAYFFSPEQGTNRKVYDDLMEQILLSNIISLEAKPLVAAKLTSSGITITGQTTTFRRQVVQEISNNFKLKHNIYIA